MIDIHSHLLPDMDDGSRSVAQSVTVLEALAASGVTDLVLTPHASVSALSEHLEDEVSRRDEAFAILAASAPPAPRLHLGFEVMVDGEPPPALLGDRRITLAGSRYLLVEFRMSVRPERVSAILQAEGLGDVVPIVAHPERYRYCAADHMAEWKALGAALQVDATTLGRHGSRGDAARTLVERGLADLAAADNHGDARSLAAAARFLAEHRAHDVGRLLTVENPRAVLDDRELSAVPSVHLRTPGLLSRLRTRI